MMLESSPIRLSLELEPWLSLSAIKSECNEKLSKIAVIRNVWENVSLVLQCSNPGWIIEMAMRVAQKVF